MNAETYTGTPATLCLCPAPYTGTLAEALAAEVYATEVYANATEGERLSGIGWLLERAISNRIQATH